MLVSNLLLYAVMNAVINSWSTSIIVVLPIVRFALTQYFYKDIRQGDCSPHLLVIIYYAEVVVTVPVTSTGVVVALDADE